MPKSRKPRKRYQPKDWNAEAARQDAQAAGESQSAEAAHPEPTQVHKPAPAPAQPHTAGPAPRAPRGHGRYLVPIAIGGAAIGGGAYLAHRSRRRQTVGKSLTDPLTGSTVVVEKRYLEDEIEGPRGVLVAKAAGLPVQSASFSTGRPWERGGTSHANKLTRVHTKVKHHPRGTLLQVKHGRRSVSGSSVGKSAAFAQSGGAGRRIVSAY